ncbi:hypothetical protein [Spirosoma endbachense]|uniref:Uncharacterized protein n=1 Tax=Spirosoma endbachense TaxID=2666025 RepID=A0A6P1VZ00_9BACT|nr:hypothetical protein [Spirosoma endbachense]QHV96636.1 hypothetical protein GJR95_17165 [Spirosoma endbachense]
MNTLFDLFKSIVAGKPVSEPENDSLAFALPNHQEDASQGGEFLDDTVWEKDESLDAGNQPDFSPNLDQ